MRVWFFAALFFSVTGMGQASVSLQLGDSVITFITENPGVKRDLLFINVHENEATSVEAIRAYDLSGEFPFVFLRHNATRRISFNIDSVVYSVDPNRIFSRKGIVATLAHDTLYSRKAVVMTKKISRTVLRHMKGARCVVSLHNNTPDNYSILSYLPGSSEAPNAREVHVNPNMDPDDFIYTTSLFLYQGLKSMNVNVILQDNKNCVDDGSLSVYCGKHGIPYANVEAEEGHLQEQITLIEKLVGLTRLLRN